jgi:ppGpp synthetase/RelA/SpoT-type nucleotidyltranferase
VLHALFVQELAHAQWPAVPGRSKDYICKPKPNGYQSLHSTLSMQSMQQLMGSSSSSSESSSVVLSYLELQVRTAAMHAAAEAGDAAHAGYKGRLERRQVRGSVTRYITCWITCYFVELLFVVLIGWPRDAAIVAAHSIVNKLSDC